MKINFDKYPLPNRVRHHVSPNYYMPWDELQKKPEKYPPLIETIDWKEHFTNENPPEFLDIGCSKGKFLMDLSEKFPEKNCLGMEIRHSLAEWLMNYINTEKFNNVSAIWYNIVNGLHFIEENSIEKIFYLFPDPWTKKKHARRRAFNPKTLEDFHRILKPGGMLYLATDVPEVNEYHIELVSSHSGFTFEAVDAEKWAMPITNKETFCIKEDIPYDRLICTKK